MTSVKDYMSAVGSLSLKDSLLNLQYEACEKENKNTLLHIHTVLYILQHMIKVCVNIKGYQCS